jgi:hypothetical protein
MRLPMYDLPHAGKPKRITSRAGREGGGALHAGELLRERVSCAKETRVCIAGMHQSVIRDKKRLFTREGRRVNGKMGSLDKDSRPFKSDERALHAVELLLTLGPITGVLQLCYKGASVVLNEYYCRKGQE